MSILALFASCLHNFLLVCFHVRPTANFSTGELPRIELPGTQVNKLVLGGSATIEASKGPYGRVVQLTKEHSQNAI